MNMEEALELVCRNCWKATCSPLSELGRNAYVVSDVNGVPCVYDGEKSMPVKTSMVLHPDVWRRAKRAEWGVTV